MGLSIINKSTAFCAWFIPILGLFHNPQGYQQINSLLRHVYPEHLVQTLSVINKSTAFCAQYNQNFGSFSQPSGLSTNQQPFVRYIPWTLGPNPEHNQQIN